jgi:hypothetical protein
MLGDELVEPLDRARESRCRAGEPLEPERNQQVDARGAAGRDPPVRRDEVPRREPLLLGQRSKERFGRVGMERQQRHAPASVEGRDGTRREAAEPSASVVQDDRSSKLHGRILPGPRA